jgi:hypothetical protein
MSDPGWQVEARPVPDMFKAEPFTPDDEASTDTYRANPYRDPFLVPVLEKLAQSDLETLSRILGGWPIPDD